MQGAEHRCARPLCSSCNEAPDHAALPAASFALSSTAAPDMQQIPPNFWSVGVLALRGPAELRLLGERNMTIDQWACVMGASCADYDLAVVPRLNRRDLKRWVRGRLSVRRCRGTAHYQQVAKELIAICREGGHQLVSADVRAAIAGKLKITISDHRWKAAKRHALEREPKVGTRFAVGRPRKNSATN